MLLFCSLLLPNRFAEGKVLSNREDRVVGFWTRDRALIQALEECQQVVFRLTDEAACLLLQSRLRVSYSRNYNWYALLALLVGYLPPSFRIEVQARNTCHARFGAESETFHSTHTEVLYTLGHAPDPEMAAVDEVFTELCKLTMERVARETARQIEQWIQEKIERRE